MACRMDLLTRAKDLGIQTEFVDGQGHIHVTDAVALRIILDALPVRAPYRFLREAVVIRSGQPSRTELNQAATSPLRWKIVRGPKIIAEGKTDDRTIVWPADLPEGAYRLHLTDAQIAELKQIMDSSDQRMRECHRTVKDQHIQKVVAMLDDSQKAEYAKMRAEREKRHQQEQAKK